MRPNNDSLLQIYLKMLEGSVPIESVSAQHRLQAEKFQTTLELLLQLSMLVPYPFKETQTTSLARLLTLAMKLRF